MSNTPIQTGNTLIDFVANACANLLRIIGHVTGLSYAAVQVLVFCVLWPLMAIGLFTFFNRSRPADATENTNAPRCDA